MADKYTVKTYTEEELQSLDDKDKEITKEYTKDFSENFTIRKLESRIAVCDEQIEKLTATKSSFQAEIDAAKAKLDE